MCHVLYQKHKAYSEPYGFSISIYIYYILLYYISLDEFWVYFGEGVKCSYATQFNKKDVYIGQNVNLNVTILDFQ